MIQKNKSHYHGSMVVFYMVCRFGWNHYTKYWDDFAELSSLYTKDSGTNALKAINAAQALPDIAQRRGSTKQQNWTISQNKPCCSGKSCAAI